MKMIDTVDEKSPRVLARLTGLFALLEALTSGFGQVIIPRMLIVSGNAAATAANILTHEALFRLSILAAFLGVACHIVWTYLAYELFKPVNRNLALVAVFFSLVAMLCRLSAASYKPLRLSPYKVDRRLLPSMPNS